MEKYRDESLSFEERAKDLLSRMTLEEKLSQMTYQSQPIERLGIPAYNWWNEALHGVARAGTATMFPQAIGLAAMFDDQELYEIADIIATEGRAKYKAYSEEGDRGIYKGLTFWSPNVNIFRDPRWGRGHETYGEDPYLTSRLGVAFVKGLQGDDPKYLKTAACAKHYAVHSGPEGLRHEFDAQVSQKDLWETYLSAFEACVKEGHVEAVMGAYNRTNGEPCCGSPTLLQKILRDTWGFQGHVVSDCWAIMDFHTHHHVTATAPESAAVALKAGCDVNCGIVYLHLQAALDDSEELMNRTTEALNTSLSTAAIVQNTLKSSSDNLDAATRDSIRGTLELLDKSLSVLDSTASIRHAGVTMKEAIDKEWDDLDGDTRFLNMDPNAEKVSFTSDENQEPESVQIILRTAEISLDDDDELLDAESEAAGQSPLRRIWNVLVKMWKAFVEIFKNR